MSIVLKIGAVALAVLAVAGAAIVTAGSIAWGRATGDAVHRLLDGAQPAPARTPGPTPGGGPGLVAAAEADARDVAAGEPLPTIVARFLARSGTAGRSIRTARFEQEGRFLLRPPERWADFTARQWVRAEPPAFLWDARIRMAPLLSVRVRDSYLDGRGSMHGAVAGLVTVARAAGTPEMASGSLYRYLAEAAWVPTRLRPSADLRWTPLDEESALATLTDGPTRVAVQFRFDADGDIIGIHVPARAREVEGGYEPTPWTGRFWDHRRVGGVRIPTRGEVGWVVDGELRPYWRGRIVDASFDLE